MVVLHALSEYLINKPPPEDLSLDVDLRLTGRKEIRYHFNPRTAYAARSSRVRTQSVNYGRPLGPIISTILNNTFSFHSCLLTLIWKWRLEGMDRESWRYSHTLTLAMMWWLLFLKMAPGLFWLQVVTHYNQLHEVDEKAACKHFELSVAIEESSGKDLNHVEMEDVLDLINALLSLWNTFTCNLN